MKDAATLQNNNYQLPRTPKIKSRILKIMKNDWQLYSLLVLPIVYYLVFKYIPILGNIIAFRKYVPGGFVFGEQWVGMRYFKMIIFDAGFWKVFSNTLIISILTLLWSFPIPIIFALLVNEVQNTWFKKFVQTTSYLPHFLSTVIVVGMIVEITSPSTGIINSIIRHFGGSEIYFLIKPEWFRTIYISSHIWQSFGWSSIIYLATLSNVNVELYESADIDGANRWKQTLYITIPAIMPTVVILLILAIGGLMGVGFEKVMLLYNPLTYETGDVISTYVYRIGLQSNNYSYATAIGMFEAVIGFFLIYVSNLLARKFTDISLW